MFFLAIAFIGVCECNVHSNNHSKVDWCKVVTKPMAANENHSQYSDSLPKIYYFWQMNYIIILRLS